MDSIEYAYSNLPQIKPVQRFGQLWDALQLRQLSLSDARIVSAALLMDAYGGVTSMMQVRANKLVIFVEDTVHDLDSMLMLPFNWSLSLLRDRPTKIKSLGYAADGLGVIRQELFQLLKFIDNKIVRLGSDALFGVKKVQDTLIRHKRKKKHGHLDIYAKMPLSVFQENRSYFENKSDAVSAGTISDWFAKISFNPDLLPDAVQGGDIRPEKILTTQDLSREVLIMADYKIWDKTPRELKKYVIAPDEFAELIQKYNPTFFTDQSEAENT